MVVNSHVRARIRGIMDQARYHRALQIPDDAITIHFCAFTPAFKISATIEGSRGDSYILEIDIGQNYIHHDCPDFEGRGSFCKHLAKFVMCLPEQVIDEILHVYQNRIMAIENMDEELDRFDLINHVDSGPNLHQGEDSRTSTQIPLETDLKSYSFEDFCIIFYDYITTCPADSTLLHDFFCHQFLTYCVTHPLKCCKWMNTHPELFEEFQSILAQLVRPVPIPIECVPQNSNYSLEFRALIQHILCTIDQKYAIHTAPGFHILL